MIFNNYLFYRYIFSLVWSGLVDKLKKRRHEMKESRIVRSILDYINKPTMNKQFKGYAWKNHGGLYGTKGLPDIMAVIMKDKKSFFLCLEIKTPTGKPTILQSATLAKFTLLGITAQIVTNLDEAKKIIEEL